MVGGKNASLGEMIQSLGIHGIRVPEGFAITADAYKLFLSKNNLYNSLSKTLDTLEKETLANLEEVGSNCRAIMNKGIIPDEVAKEIIMNFNSMNSLNKTSVAVRSSATAEDLPTASFAGQHDSFLNVSSIETLLDSVKRCYISLFNDRAIKYRVDNGFEHMKVFLSAGVQKMVNTDQGSSGVAFTVDPESGFLNVVYITASWGLGENIVQGKVNPDEFYLFKPSVEKRRRSIISKTCGSKENMMIYTSNLLSPVKNVETPHEKRTIYSITDKDAEQLGIWCVEIEKHYKLPMDIEWAKDGAAGELYILQARPETVQSQQKKLLIKEYTFNPKQLPVCTGKAVGRSIVSGTARLITSPDDATKVQKGDIIIADITNPDWNNLLRKAVSIVTNKGGRTSHASIVARELGIHAVVGTGNATELITDGSIITVSCIEGDMGKVYKHKLEWDEKQVHVGNMEPAKTKPMFILADPGNAFRLSFYPNAGVGLLRMEFIISNMIGIHPMALIKYLDLDEKTKAVIDSITSGYIDKKKYFVEKLSQAIAMVAAAFYPKEVIVRMSDFKTNEYSRLAGGKEFEPDEENPMLGFRGASRYYNPLYREGFGLECEAVRVVREEMSLNNIKVMIPFCRTPAEGRKVLEVMKSFGLERGKNGLQVYVMAELPSNVILAQEFAKIFDGFSIGSNDLTQLTLGIDRDSAIVSDLFDENNEAVKRMLRMVISEAKAAGIPVGLCGQAPSDFLEYAHFLVQEGIDSISFNPDAIVKGIENILYAEKNQEKKPAQGY